MLCKYVAESQCGVGAVVGYRAVYALLNLVQRHGGTVVEKEIVAVNTVLHPAVFYKKLI